MPAAAAMNHATTPFFQSSALNIASTPQWNRAHQHSLRKKQHRHLQSNGSGLGLRCQWRAPTPPSSSTHRQTTTKIAAFLGGGNSSRRRRNGNGKIVAEEMLGAALYFASTLIPTGSLLPGPLGDLLLLLVDNEAGRGLGYRKRGWWGWLGLGLRRRRKNRKKGGAGFSGKRVMGIVLKFGLAVALASLLPVVVLSKVKLL